jgi:hypothetical protein
MELLSLLSTTPADTADLCRDLGVPHRKLQNLIRELVRCGYDLLARRDTDGKIISLAVTEKGMNAVYTTAERYVDSR